MFTKTLLTLRLLTSLKSAQLTIHDCLFKLFMNPVSTTTVIHLGNVTGSIRREICCKRITGKMEKVEMMYYHYFFMIFFFFCKNQIFLFEIIPFFSYFKVLLHYLSLMNCSKWNITLGWGRKIMFPTYLSVYNSSWNMNKIWLVSSSIV